MSKTKQTGKRVFSELAEQWTDEVVQRVWDTCVVKGLVDVPKARVFAPQHEAVALCRDCEHYKAERVYPFVVLTKGRCGHEGGVYEGDAVAEGFSCYNATKVVRDSTPGGINLLPSGSLQFNENYYRHEVDRLREEVRFYKFSADRAADVARELDALKKRYSDLADEACDLRHDNNELRGKLDMAEARLAQTQEMLQHTQDILVKQSMAEPPVRIVFDGAKWMGMDPAKEDDKPQDRDDYEALMEVFQSARHQAAHGKGQERHAEDDTPYTEQPTMRDTKSLGVSFPIGQGIKKARESKGLIKTKGVDAAVNELLGAINYLATAVIALRKGWNPEGE
jgi:regulator of replication initiation timing